MANPDNGARENQHRTSVNDKATGNVSKNDGGCAAAVWEAYPIFRSPKGNQDNRSPEPLPVKTEGKMASTEDEWAELGNTINRSWKYWSDPWFKTLHCAEDQLQILNPVMLPVEKAAFALSDTPLMRGLGKQIGDVVHHRNSGGSDYSHNLRK